jgi:hypothetical protein
MTAEQLALKFKILIVALMRRVFVAGIIVYGLALITVMGKRTNLSTWNDVASTKMALARYADMPPVIELRKEGQSNVTYKDN